jgi:hypothetical protein
VGTKYVKYVGLSHVRAVLKEEWLKVGVNDQKAIIWNQANGWMVPLSDITDNAWPYIDADPELIVVEVDRLTRPVGEETPPSEAVADMVNDQTTGAETVVVDAEGNRL